MTKRVNTSRPDTLPARFRKHRRRGFATFSAVALLGTTAIALTALAGVTMHQAQRTRDALCDAQLRQLLKAGQSHAEQGGADAASGSVTLPDTLVGDQAAVTWVTKQSSGDSPATIEITAHLRGRAARETLIFDPGAGAWRVMDVELP